MIQETLRSVFFWVIASFLATVTVWVVGSLPDSPVSSLRHLFTAHEVFPLVFFSTLLVTAAHVPIRITSQMLGWGHRSRCLLMSLYAIGWVSYFLKAIFLDGAPDIGPEAFWGLIALTLTGLAFLCVFEFWQTRRQT